MKRASCRLGLAILAVSLLPFTAGAEPPADDPEEVGRARAVPQLYPVPATDPGQRVADAHRGAVDGSLLRLKAAVFDPVLDGEPDFTAVLPEGPELRAATESAGRYYLIQFDTTPGARIYDALAARGAGVMGYVPNRALVVRLPAGATEEVLRAIPSARAVGSYLPGYKLAPPLFHIIRSQAFEEERISVDVALFRDEDPDRLASAIGARFEDVRIESVRRRPPARITVDVPTGSLASVVGSLIGDPAVEFVERHLLPELHNDNSVWIGQSYDRVAGPIEAEEPDPKPYTLSATIWNHGLTGTGQIVGVADTGLESDMCFFDDPAHEVVPQSVVAPNPIQVNPDHRKVLAINDPNGGESWLLDGSFRHGTHVSGSVAGDDLAHLADGSSAGHDHGDGMAPDAKIVLEDLSAFTNSTCSTALHVPYLDDLLQQQYDAGARISTNSYGSSGGYYSQSSADIDRAIWQNEDLNVFFSAGNDGNFGVADYAACKSCIGVGAAENYNVGLSLDPENMSVFSGRGPAADGRIKPDLAAPGVWIDSPRFPTQYIGDETDPRCDDTDPNVCFPYFGGCYITDTSQTCGTAPLSGTSMSSPTAAGLAALARQYFTDGFYPSGAANPSDSRSPSAALLKSVLLNGSRNMTGNDPLTSAPLEDAPSGAQGWGRIMLDDALYFAGDSRKLYLVENVNAAGMATGEAVEIDLSVTTSDQPLKLTLAWSDPPGSVSAGAALVNDLDLELRAPDGTVYRGNQWTADDVNVPGDKHSLADPTGRDALNTVEGILIPSPQIGEYTVTLRGVDVPGYQGVLTQGYALVATGAVEEYFCTTAAPPPNVTVDDVDGVHVDLSWDEVPGAVGYNLYRNGSVCATPMAVDTVIPIPAGQTSYRDTAVLPDTSYNYTVKAVMSGDGCETTGSACVTAVTPPAPKVLTVDPKFGLNNDPTPITITGLHFVDVPRVFLGTDQDPEKIELAHVSFVSPTELSATVPINLIPDKYDVKVVNPDTLADSRSNAFLVAGPLQANNIAVVDGSFLPSTFKLVDRDQFVVTSQIETGDNTNNSDLATDPVSRNVVVSSYWKTYLRVFNMYTNEPEGNINISSTSPCVIAHPDGNRIYALGKWGTGGGGQVFVVDLDTMSLVTAIQIARVVDGNEIVLSPDATRLYATTFAGETWDPLPASVSVIRTSDHTEIATIPVEVYPRGLAVSGDNSRLYVTNLYSQSISVIDTTTLTVVDTIDVSDPDCVPGGPWCENQPEAVVVSPDHSTLWVGLINRGFIKVDLATGDQTRASAGTYRQLTFKDGTLYGIRSGDVVRIDTDTLTIVTADESQIPFSNSVLGMDFVEPDPVEITGVTPSLGCARGGTKVLIEGSGFQGEVRDDGGAVIQERTRVFFGGVEATSVQLINSHALRAIAPANKKGLVDVTVENPNGSTSTLPDGFLYTSVCPGPRVPGPVPSGGGGGGSPMLVDQGSQEGRLAITLEWDTTTCQAEDYHVVYGPLNDLSTHTVTGGECDLGTLGSYLWLNVPAGDLWFVVVADDGAGVEGTWGLDSSGENRGGSAVSGQCGLTERDNGGSCP